MTGKVVLKICDIVATPIWVSADDGQKVYERISAAFKSGCTVDLSFYGKENLITAFLNAAIGQLYNGEYTEDFLEGHLNFVDISESDRAMVERAINNAKRYFANRSTYDQAWKDEIDEE